LLTAFTVSHFACSYVIFRNHFTYSYGPFISRPFFLYASRGQCLLMVTETSHVAAILTVNRCHNRVTRKAAALMIGTSYGERWS
jgi:hypothetical protein